MWWLWHTGGGKWWNGSPPPEALHLIALHLFPFHCKVLVILIQMLTNTSVKEVQTTLPLTFYRCIFEKIDSQYRKHFWAVLLSAPPQGYTYIDEYSRLLHWNLTISKPKWKSSNFKKLPKEGDFFTICSTVWEFKLKLISPVSKQGSMSFNAHQTNNWQCCPSQTVCSQSP